jgi:hypothetical protein
MSPSFAKTGSKLRWKTGCTNKNLIKAAEVEEFSKMDRREKQKRNLNV